MGPVDNPEDCGPRRMLPLASVLVVAAITCCTGLPAQAAAPVTAAPAPALRPQVYTAPAFAAASVTRDSFAVIRLDRVQWPLSASTPISDGYGYRSCTGCSSFHEGIDFTPGDGYPVQTIADGVVVESEYSGALGQHVIIQHVVAGQILLSLYGHLTAGSATVAAGDSIDRGAVIGLVGSTGQSTGPHLHFGIQVDGVLIDPYPWLSTHANS